MTKIEFWKSILGKIRFLIGVFAILFLASCATTDDLQPGRGTKFIIKGKTYSLIWSAAKKVIGRDIKI